MGTVAGVALLAGQAAMAGLAIPAYRRRQSSSPWVTFQAMDRFCFRRPAKLADPGRTVRKAARAAGRAEAATQRVHGPTATTAEDQQANPVMAVPVAREGKAVPGGLAAQ